MEAFKEALKDIDRRYVGACFAFNIRAFIYLGGWPLQEDEKYLVLKYLRILKYAMVFGASIGMSSCIGGAIFLWGDLEKMAECVVFLIVIETAMVKLYLVFFRIDDISDLVRILEGVVAKCLRNKDEGRIFRRYRRAGNLFTFCYALFCFVSGVSYGVLPLFREGRRRPADLWCPVDCSKSPLYEVMYLGTWTMTISLGMMNALMDTLCMSMLMYTIGQFRILQYRMEHSRKYALRQVALNSRGQKNTLTISRPDVYVRRMSGNDEPEVYGRRSEETALTIHEPEVYGCRSTETTLTIHEPEVYGRILSRNDESEVYARRMSRNNEPELYLRISEETTLTIHEPEVRRRMSRSERETIVDITTPNSNEMNLIQHKRHYRQHRTMLKAKSSVRGRGSKRRTRRFDSSYSSDDLLRAKKIEEQKTQHELDREINHHLVECIQNQQMLLRFSRLLQKNFGQMFFSELLFAGLVICILLFLIATFKTDPGKMVEWGSILIVAIVQLFAFCWFSSELAYQSSLLNDALYYSDWVNAPSQFKKMMRTVMSRALHPVQLTAGGFLPFSVMQFQAVMQSAYSYYATLTEFNAKQ